MPPMSSHFHQTTYTRIKGTFHCRKSALHHLDLLGWGEGRVCDESLSANASTNAGLRPQPCSTSSLSRWEGLLYSSCICIPSPGPWSLQSPGTLILNIMVCVFMMGALAQVLRERRCLQTMNQPPSSHDRNKWLFKYIPDTGLHVGREPLWL
jgi:hypothetical protein